MISRYPRGNLHVQRKSTQKCPSPEGIEHIDHLHLRAHIPCRVLVIVTCALRTGVPHLVLGEVIGQPPDEDLVVAVGDSARDDAKNRQIQLRDRPRPGARTPNTTHATREYKVRQTPPGTHTMTSGHQAREKKRE